MADPRARRGLTAIAVLALGGATALTGCAPPQSRAGGEAPTVSAGAAPAPMLAVAPVPRPPARGTAPARPAAPPNPAPEIRAAAPEASSVPGVPAPAPAAPDLSQALGEALPDAISRALTEGAAQGAVLDAPWRNGPARFMLGPETPAIRTMPLPLAVGIRPPGPLEVLAEPLLLINPGALSPAPDPVAVPARTLERGVIVFAMGLTAERDWAAIAEGGVMVGYVPAEILAPLSATGPVAALPPRTDPAGSMAPVPIATRCRAITVTQGQAIESAEACLHPDGAWRISPASR